jgi:hypothetical protein
VEDGVCFLKTIIDNYHSNTRSSTKQIRKQLATLNHYMRNVAKGDVTKLCEHTRELIFELNAAGETTSDGVNGISKTYYWCPYHLQWTIHSPKECKRLPTGKGKSKPTDKKVIK